MNNSVIVSNLVLIKLQKQLTQFMSTMNMNRWILIIIEIAGL